MNIYACSKYLVLQQVRTSHEIICDQVIIINVYMVERITDNN